jgi:hypothetical protein
VLKGRGKLQKRRVVVGDLEISSGPSDDLRLREWTQESRAVLPRLHVMVRNGDRAPAGLSRVVEDLRQRVEELEEQLVRLRGDRVTT